MYVQVTLCWCCSIDVVSWSDLSVFCNLQLQTQQTTCPGCKTCGTQPKASKSWHQSTTAPVHICCHFSCFQTRPALPRIHQSTPPAATLRLQEVVAYVLALALPMWRIPQNQNASYPGKQPAIRPASITPPRLPRRGKSETEPPFTTIQMPPYIQGDLCKSKQRLCTLQASRTWTYMHNWRCATNYNSLGTSRHSLPCTHVARPTFSTSCADRSTRPMLPLDHAGLSSPHTHNPNQSWLSLRMRH